MFASYLKFFKSISSKIFLFSKIFEQTPGNLAFVSVIGPKNSGKSSLLDKLLKTREFQGNHVSEGVWLHKTPIFIENQGLYVYFLEFEGYEEYETSSVFEEKLIILAMALSSAIMLLNGRDYEENHEKFFSLLSFFDEYVSNFNENCMKLPHLFSVLRGNTWNSGLGRSKILNFTDKYDYHAINLGNTVVNSLRNQAESFNFEESELLMQKLLNKSLKKEILGVSLTGTLFSKVITSIIERLNLNLVLDFQEM